VRRSLLDSQRGSIIAPPLSEFYVNPAGLETLLVQTLGRVPDLVFGTIKHKSEPSSRLNG
jgi:3-polyprenyl-4-hydroxybenzoate decarboxylase